MNSKIFVAVLFVALLVGMNASVMPANGQVEIEGTVPSAQWTWTYDPNIDNTSCDGFYIRDIYHDLDPSSPTVPNNYVFARISMPLIKVKYPNGVTLVDQPVARVGSGCQAASYVQTGPEEVGVGSASRPASLVYALFWIGGSTDSPCSDLNFQTGCYKYEEQFNFRDNYTTSTGTVDPKFKHILKAYGNGYSQAQGWGYPIYQAYFRIDFDVPATADGDKFKRYTGTGSTFAVIQNEDSSPDNTCECWVEATNSGAQWRMIDGVAGDGTAKKMNIDPLPNDDPWVWVLQMMSTETDPTGNSAADVDGAKEPKEWVNVCNPDCTTVRDTNILYWYKTNRQSSATACSTLSTGTFPCSMGPTVILKNGL